ncbi:hypothetical protein EDC04DRAFT_2599897 [Pisolithus marmoratus]|nr:hypothetical protein EDC04DRAFT_2599897 [Pisolithus marmoratus]
MGTGMGVIVSDCALADQRVDVQHFHSDLAPRTESHLSANSSTFTMDNFTAGKARNIHHGTSTHKANASQYDSYAAYELAGRKMACLINPNFSPCTALKVGVMDSHGHYKGIPMEQSEINQYLDIYHLMLWYVPWLEDELKIMDVPEFDKVVNKLTKGMSKQCSMDLGSVKHAGLAYIPFNMNMTSALDPPLSKGEDKSDCGFNHPQIVQLLCPHKKLHLFDEDEASTIIALQTGAIPITTYNWLSFFYEDGVYDPQNQHRGLFHGHIAWQFYVHLFIGPSAAAKGVVTSNTAKRAKNRAWTLMEVTPHIIAYVHVIKWTNTTGSIDLAEMAWMIVDMFENRDEWTRETLHWWNTYISFIITYRHAFLHRVQNGLRSLKRCLEPESDDNVMHIHTKHGSTIGSNALSAGSSGTFGNDISSNHASLASGSSKLSSTGGTRSPVDIGSNSNVLTTGNCDGSPLTSDREEEPPVLEPVCRPKPVPKKCKKVDEMIFATDTKDPPASTTVETAKAATHTTCQHGGKKRTNSF